MSQFKEITLRRSSIVSTLVLVGVVASPALLHAQANPNSGMDNTTVTDRDDNSNWGWLGLLGLAGLLGLKRSDREKMHDQVRTRPTT